MKNEELYGWSFTFSPFTQTWRAYTRDQANDAFSTPESNFLRSKNLATLQEIVMKTGGDQDKINKLLKTK